MRIGATCLLLLVGGAFLVLGASRARAGDEVTPGPIERALQDPPATGLLVLSVGDGTQAHRLGIAPGDVLVTYGDTAVPTTEALGAAIKAAAGKAAIPLKLVRGTQRLTIDLAPGAIGVTLVSVTEGKPPPPLPAANVATIPWSGLEASPPETWYEFSLDGTTTVGFDRTRLGAEDGRVVLTREVAFDGGERWGGNHQVVVVVARIVAGVLVPESTRYENVLAKWVGLGARREREGGRAVWEVRWPPADGQPQMREEALPTDLPILPSYLVEAAAARLPRRPGACYQFRQLNEGVGTIDLPCALLVLGPEDLEQDGVRAQAWKIELRTLVGGTAQTFWVAEDGRVLRIHYGAAWATLSTKEEVVAALPDGVEPQPPAR